MRLLTLAIATSLSCLLTVAAVAQEKESNRLSLRVLRFHDLISPGTTLRCELDDSAESGFIIQQPWQGKDVSITPFMNGQLAPLGQTMQAELKDSPDPLVLLVAYQDKKGDVELNVEFLLNRKMNGQGTYDGAAAFTQVKVTQNAEGAEARALKPLGLRKLSCSPSN